MNDTAIQERQHHAEYLGLLFRDRSRWTVGELQQ